MAWNNDGEGGAYKTNSWIKVKTKMLKSSLCNYSHACEPVKWIITVSDTSATAAIANNANKIVIFQLCHIYLLHKRNKQCLRSQSSLKNWKF